MHLWDHGGGGLTALSLRILIALCLLGETAWASHRQYTFYADVECQNATWCSLYFARALEAKYGCKFVAETETDTLCGALQIVHCDPASPGLASDPVCRDVMVNHQATHRVDVYLYDTDEPPTARRKSHLTPMASFPTETEIDAEIKQVPKPWSRMNGFEHRTAKQARQDAAIASGDAKLKALGLTGEEIEARR